MKRRARRGYPPAGLAGGGACGGSSSCPTSSSKQGRSGIRTPAEAARWSCCCMGWRWTGRCGATSSTRCATSTAAWSRPCRWAATGGPGAPTPTCHPAESLRLQTEFLDAPDLREVTLVGNDSGLFQLTAAQHPSASRGWSSASARRSTTSPGSAESHRRAGRPAAGRAERAGATVAATAATLPAARPGVDGQATHPHEVTDAWPAPLLGQPAIRPTWPATCGPPPPTQA
jgi:hypothetical protein